MSGFNITADACDTVRYRDTFAAFVAEREETRDQSHRRVYTPAFLAKEAEHMRACVTLTRQEMARRGMVGKVSRRPQA